MKYNRFLKQSLSSLSKLKSDSTNTMINGSEDSDAQEKREPYKNRKIGILDTEPRRMDNTPKGLTPHQQALREAVIKEFSANRVKKYIAKQIQHINFNMNVADGIRLLFDEHGRPPANAPLEDIVAERQKIEDQIRMLEAICSALRHHLTKIREIEDQAVELIGQVYADD